MTVPQPLKPEHYSYEDIFITNQHFDSKWLRKFLLLRLNAIKEAILTSNVQNINSQIKAGQCPHGLPFGACPICSGAGGTSRKSDRNYTRPGEMTYHECVIMGNMLKARALAQKHHKKLLNQQQLNTKNFEATIEKISIQINSIIESLSKNILLKPVALIVKTTVLPILRLIQTTQNFIQNIKNFVFEITDKLNAIYGEAKAFIEKKVSEIVQVIKSKIKKLFKISTKENVNDEDSKIDDDKKIFNLKTILRKIKIKLSKKKEKDA